VIVDLRRSSPTFGVWDGYVLNTETHDRLYVPPGCAHGFMVLSEVCDFFYKVTTPYQPAADRSLRWNDPDLAIDWPIEIGLDPIVSPKDAAAATFAEYEKNA
jgi:dTDP-4-dehydrorhamnose 3,5-epimerase